MGSLVELNVVPKPCAQASQLSPNFACAGYGYGNFPDRMNSASARWPLGSGSPLIWNTWTIPGQTSNFTLIPSERAFFPLGRCRRGAFRARHLNPSSGGIT